MLFMRTSLHTPIHTPIHDPIIIAISIAHFNLKNVEMKEKIDKNLNIKKIKSLDGIKSIFDNF